MRFLAPSALFWLLLGLFAIALFLFRRKPRRIPVTSLAFFKALAQEHQESAWLRRLKRLLALLMSLIVIAGATFVLAGAVISPKAGNVRTVVIALDRSASMGAKNAGGQTRMDLALDAIRTRLAGLPHGVEVLVLAYDQRAEIMQPRSLDRREVLRSLEQVRPRAAEEDYPAAMRLAGQLARMNLPAEIWDVTDQAHDYANEDKELKTVPVLVGNPDPHNVGITAFEVRPLPLERNRFEAFVQVCGTGVTDAKVEVRLGGALTALREVTLKGAEPQTLLLPVEAAAGELLSISVKAGKNDLAEDDVVLWQVPDQKPIKVLWICDPPDPFMMLALQTLTGEEGIEMYQGKPSDWPAKDPFDVVIFEKWVPETWPENISVMVIDPPKSCGPIKVGRIGESGLPLESIRTPQEHHPLLYGVATGRANPLQTAVIEAESLQPLWVGPSGPVLLAGELRGQRIVAMGFAPDRSPRLPLMTSFPMLIGNAIFWLKPPEASGKFGRTMRVGSVVPVKGDKIRWTTVAGNGTRNESAELEGGWVELNRVGVWETSAGTSGSVALLSERETSLVAGPQPAESLQTSKSWLRGDLTVLLLTLVGATLLLESWLFHRHSVY